jgi:adenylate kinase family enzyme
VTLLVNLWAGPGAGKSTLAAELFAALKREQVPCELVTEWVKTWAWEQRQIGPFDDVTITANQLHRESILYGKVEVIVTDSPIGLGAVYEQIYHPDRNTMGLLCGSLRARQLAEGIKILDLYVVRAKPYVQAGRYEDEEKARQVDRVALRYVQGLSDVTGVRDVAEALEWVQKALKESDNA